MLLSASVPQIKKDLELSVAGTTEFESLINREERLLRLITELKYEIN